MLRQAASRLLGQVGRRFTTSASRLEEAAPAGAKEFLEAWNKTAPSTLAPPELPTNFLPPEPSRDAAADGEKFAVNFYTPHETVAEAKVSSPGAQISSKLGRLGRNAGALRPPNTGTSGPDAPAIALLPCRLSKLSSQAWRVTLV